KSCRRPEASWRSCARGATIGGSGSRLSKELLAEYQDLTFLTKQEILLAHRRFCELLPPEHRSVEESLQMRVSLEQILSLPELKANPFKERICRVFSTSPARDSLSFEDFLDLLSVFSDTATPDIKSHYAFRIFDFDDDGTLNREDLSHLVNCLTGQGEDTRLSASEMKQLIDNVSRPAGPGREGREGPGLGLKLSLPQILEESDIDRDGTINLSEFQHVISRSPDFASSFKIVL
ncbi:LOW QUALITY PROTEIN: calcium and integrin-binding protein 1, partial [Eumetopias jubatus]|uniref:LOW QUALITY PROTEIN: calcium and integrin-binding protein 1 n=1 Tax=Eumetopias jubatus TaxID=34886 RepID=UPI0010164205